MTTHRRSHRVFSGRRATNPCLDQGALDDLNFKDYGGFKVVRNWLVTYTFWGQVWTPAQAELVIEAAATIIDSNNSPYLKPLQDDYGIAITGESGSFDIVPTDPPHSPFSDDDVKKMLAMHWANREVPNALWIHCVFMPPSFPYTDPSVLGAHGMFNIALRNPVTNSPTTVSLPYMWVGSGILTVQLPALTVGFSHELVETLTDPDPTHPAIASTSTSPAYNGGYCEIADPCVGSAYAYRPGVVVEAYWSQGARKCIQPS